MYWYIFIVIHVPHCCGMLIVGVAMKVWRKEGEWEISVLSTQFCSEPKIILKINNKNNSNNNYKVLIIYQEYGTLIPFSGIIWHKQSIF